MINFIDTSRSASVYSSLPVIGPGPEPEWFTRQVAAGTRLRELERDRRISVLISGRDSSIGVVGRFRTALRLA